MKKIVALLAALALLSGWAQQALAQQTWFPTKVGSTLLYENKDAKGKVTGYDLYRITKVTEDEGKTTIWYHTYAMDANRKVAMHIPNAKVWTYNGYFHADASSALNSIDVNLDQIMEISGTGMKMPENPQVGDDLGSVSVKIPIVLEVNETNITVGAKESYETPAGSFDCVRVDGTVSGKVLIIKVNGSVKEWYAKGIGVVRSETTMKQGTTTKTLVSVNGDATTNGEYEWAKSIFQFGEGGAAGGIAYGNGLEGDFVDMCSTVDWATKNLDAAKATDAGTACSWDDINDSSTGWRAPTKAEWDSLVNNCKWEYTTIDGVEGYKVIAKNENWIFLPVVDGVGNYWSSTKSIEEKKNAYKLVINEEMNKVTDVPFKDKSFLVRPVRDTYSSVK